MRHFVPNPVHSCRSYQTAQTLEHLHFFCLSATHLLACLSPYNFGKLRLHTDSSSHFDLIIYYSTHFGAPRTLHLSFIICIAIFSHPPSASCRFVLKIIILNIIHLSTCSSGSPYIVSHSLDAHSHTSIEYLINFLFFPHSLETLFFSIHYQTHSTVYTAPPNQSLLLCHWK